MGDDITPCVAENARTLFISNHIDTDDIFLQHDFINSKLKMASSVMWLPVERLKYLPPGFYMKLRKDFFIKNVNICVIFQYCNSNKCSLSGSKISRRKSSKLSKAFTQCIHSATSFYYAVSREWIFISIEKCQRRICNEK